MRVVQLGFGAVGKENIRQLRGLGYELAGIVDTADVLDKIDLSALRLGDAPPVMETNLERCLFRANANVVLQSTTYDPEHILRTVTEAAVAKCDVISANGIVDILEIDATLAASIDRIARENGIRVLGVGIVPGYFSDALPLFLTGACANVTAVRFKLTTDFNKYGPDVMRRFGFGMAPGEFVAMSEAGKLGLFERLWQSAHLIVHDLSWQIEKTSEAKQPFTSARERKGDYTKVAAGFVGGFSHRVTIQARGGRTVQIEVIGYLDPAGEAEQPSMSIEVDGDPSLSVDIKGGVLTSVGGLTSTSARMVNSIAPLAKVAPGYRTTADLPIVARRDRLTV